MPPIMDHSQEMIGLADRPTALPTLTPSR
jgi:hypothetical protein